MAKVPDFYPKVNLILSPKENIVKEFNNGPSGITIHYTASRDVNSTHAALMKNGLNYHLMIDRLGLVTQCAVLTHSVYHAGKARWNEQSPNRKHISIALLNWGKLENGRAWTGQGIPKEDIRTLKDGSQWHKATIAQENTLLDMCKWFTCLGIPRENVCGHDECAIPKGRKLDPGGVLSFSMDQFRDLLISIV